MAFGRNLLARIGGDTKVSADGEPDYKIGGVTLYWGGVTAQSGTVQLTPQGTTSTITDLALLNSNGWLDVIEDGEKFLRYGTVICRISGGSFDGLFAPYGTSASGGTLLKTKGDMYVLNESVHQGDEENAKAIEGGLVFKHRLVVNFNKVVKLDTLSASGGTFTLTYKGQTTTALAYNASASTVQAAIVALSTVGANNATVALNSGVYTITLGAALAPFSALSFTNSMSGGTSANAALVAVADTADGPTQAEFEAAFPDFRYVNELN